MQGAREIYIHIYVCTYIYIYTLRNQGKAKTEKAFLYKRSNINKGISCVKFINSRMKIE